jgi:ATPase family AAA domain-containing protein 2
MDGMDDRGQIVVIGATNRPDSIDPAFRRPGRFDREFRFELPNLDARRSIIDIHTRHWDPAPPADLKDYLAKATTGYAGADLGSLCAEATVAAIQRTYPQIYRSDKKLLIDPAQVKITAMDFVKVMDRIIPSTQREHVTAPEPIPKRLEPLLQESLDDISDKVQRIIPSKRKRMTALEEAEYDTGAFGFEQDEFLRAFENGRIFRPRLLIKAKRGMGQQHLTSALMHRLDSFYVRNLDIATLHSDPMMPPEAFLVAAFKEAKRNEPSVLVIPEVDVWYTSVTPTVVNTFSRLLKSLKPTDAILVLGTIEMEKDEEEPNPSMMKDIFGFSSKHEYQMVPPGKQARLKFFEPLRDLVEKRPTDFPDPELRKKRKLPQLPLAPIQPKVLKQKTKEETKAQRKADKSVINILRAHLRTILKDAMGPYKRFHHSIIPDRDIAYLLQESDPDYMVLDLPEDQRIALEHRRPYEVVLDKHGNRMLLQTETGKKFYNCNLSIIQERVVNGYYKRPKEFLWDLKTILKDHMQGDNIDNARKANDLYGGLSGEVLMLETREQILMERCEGVYKRELEREKEFEKAQLDLPTVIRGNVPLPAPDSTVLTENAPIQFGTYQGRPELPPPQTPTRPPYQLNPDAMTNGAANGTHEPAPVTAIADGTQPAAPYDLSTSGSRPQFPTGYTATPSNPTTATQQQRSQQSALEKMAPGTQADDYANDASTTNSAQKTVSQRTSGNGSVVAQPGTIRPSSNGTTSQNSSGNPYHLDWDDMMPPSDSQLPDTQSDSTSKRASTNNTFPDSLPASLGFPRTQSNGSQLQQSAVNSNHNTQGGPDPTDPAFIKPAVPQASTGVLGTIAATHAARYAANMAVPQLPPILTGASQALTNGTSKPTSPIEPETPHAPYTLDIKKLESTLEDIAQRTDGLTVEQLEMVDARCMAVIWENRGSWDRTEVADKILEAVEEVLEDVLWQEKVVELANREDK